MVFECVYSVEYQLMGHNFKGIVKTMHIKTPKAYRQGKVKNLPAGIHPVMESAKNGNIIYDLLGIHIIQGM